MSRIAVMAIIVEKKEAVKPLNELLHEYCDYIIGRMGIPYNKRELCLVSVAVDAPQDIISALAGKVGCIDGISVKTAYSNVLTDDER